MIMHDATNIQIVTCSVILRFCRPGRRERWLLRLHFTLTGPGLPRLHFILTVRGILRLHFILTVRGLHRLHFIPTVRGLLRFYFILTVRGLDRLQFIPIFYSHILQTDKTNKLRPTDEAVTNNVIIISAANCVS